MPAAALGLQRYKAKSVRPNFSLILNCMLYLQCRYLYYSLRWHFLYYWEIPDNSGFRWVTANQDFTINLYMKTMARHVFFFQYNYWTRYQNWIFETRLSISSGSICFSVGRILITYWEKVGSGLQKEFGAGAIFSKNRIWSKYPISGP